MLDAQDLQAISDLMNVKFNGLRDELTEQISEVRADLIDQVSGVRTELFSYLENTVDPKLQLLAEGQQNLLETLAPKSKTDALEQEVIFLKSVLKSYGTRITELEQRIS